MKTNNKLQNFASPTGMTGSDDINVTAREIDFTTSFAKNVQALLDILGISRMIKKPNGTVLKKKKASGTLQSGNVGEGENIPLSKFEVTESPYDTISIEKYRKAVPIESIAEHGYDYAVTMTDEEFKSQLRDVVLDKFYTYMMTGTLKSTEKTWKKAIAMSIGRVKDKFKKLHRNCTGVAVWVNTIDLYDYLGDKDMTIENAFGMDYIKSFMGADLVFISSEIEPGKVVATPLNNIVAYYIDPGDSEFARAGLSYTTDATTGFIGFHTEGSYVNAVSEAYALMGVRLFAEFQDGIAVITVDDTPAIGSLSITSVAGTEPGDTKVTVSPSKETPSNIYKYKVAASATAVVYGQDLSKWTDWDGEADITAATNKVITIAECDAQAQAQNEGHATVTAKA